MIEAITIHCPFCGEAFETSADTSAGSQTYVEDCAVCCRPIVISLEVDEASGELADVRTRRESD